MYFDLITSSAFDGPRVKVGETGNNYKRLAQHNQSKFGVEFNAARMCAVRGTRADEQQVIRHFKEHLVKNEEETFTPADELIDYIRWLRDQWFVWVPDCDQCKPVDEIEEVSPDQWMPRQERSKKPPAQLSMFSDFAPLNLPPRSMTADDFYTSKVIVDAARRSLGGIDLDPASHSIANSVVRATRFFTVADNGLDYEWSGRVWLNPPFSQWQLWVPKIVSEWRSGRVSGMCVLCATRTLTAQYFSDLLQTSSAMCILRGRIPFWGGKAKDSPDDGHAVFYFGDDVDGFRESFSGIGNVFRK